MRLVLFIIILFASIQTAKAQKNGVRGYGNISVIYVNAEYSTDNYICSGGGVIVNDNLIFGAYLNALKIPYRYNFLEEDNTFAENPFSTNPNAITTTINNIETGMTIGLNIAPEKPFQATIKQHIGYSIVSFAELSTTGSNPQPGETNFVDNVYNIGGFNVWFQADLQLKIGGSFKLGLISGFHASHINGKQGGDTSVLKNQRMFTGLYFGAGLTFGSF